MVSDALHTWDYLTLTLSTRSLISWQELLPCQACLGSKTSGHGQVRTCTAWAVKLSGLLQGTRGALPKRYSKVGLAGASCCGCHCLRTNQLPTHRPRSPGSVGRDGAGISLLSSSAVCSFLSASLCSLATRPGDLLHGSQPSQRHRSPSGNEGGWLRQLRQVYQMLQKWRASLQLQRRGAAGLSVSRDCWCIAAEWQAPGLRAAHPCCQPCRVPRAGRDAAALPTSGADAYRRHSTNWGTRDRVSGAARSCGPRPSAQGPLPKPCHAVCGLPLCGSQLRAGIRSPSFLRYINPYKKISFNEE